VHGPGLLARASTPVAPCRAARMVSHCRAYLPAPRRAQRQFNTAHLLGHYMGEGALAADAIAWNLNDPNVLSIRLPGAPCDYFSTLMRISGLFEFWRNRNGSAAVPPGECSPTCVPPRRTRAGSARPWAPAGASVRLAGRPARAGPGSTGETRRPRGRLGGPRAACGGCGARAGAQAGLVRRRRAGHPHARDAPVPGAAGRPGPPRHLGVF